MKVAVKYFLLICYMISLSFHAHSYVISRAPNGSFIKWNSSVNQLTMYANLANSKGFSDQDVFSIMDSSVQKWNGLSRITSSVISVKTGSTSKRNDIYFSTSPLLFSSTSVLGVTQVVFSETSGEIYEADIAINDNVNYTTNSLDSYYLGNILTHEVGHLLGLSHSQVKDSTMFYSIAVGQHEIDQDDKAGAFANYPHVNKGTITGKIVGGNNLVGIFGAHVQAISTLSGEIEGATLSEENGVFKIDGLPLDDTFYIYVEPLERFDTLPSLFATTQTNFCNSGKSFRGSFFQSCLTSDIGYPTGVELSTTATDKNIGNVTIRCSLDVPTEYFRDKTDNVATTFTLGESSATEGQAMVGFFTANDVNNTDKDELLLDYTNFTANTSDLYLDIKITGHKFGEQYLEHIISNERNYTKVDLSLVVNGTTVNSSIGEDGGIDLDRRYRVALDPNASNNLFNVEVIPTKIGGTVPLSLYSDQFRENLVFYLMTVSLVKKESDNSFTLYGMKEYTNYSDNSSCPDAAGSYYVPAQSAAATNSSSNGATTEFTLEEDDGAISCGTIDIDNDSGGNGPLSFVIGFLLIAMLKTRKNISIFFLD